MRTANAQIVLFAVLVVVLIVWAPQSVLAQRGHGGGGGGFYGGGSWHGGGWNGGGSWRGGTASWHGGNVWHGGRYGWGGGYWGSPGWSFAVGFNFGPFWGGWGYPWAPFFPVYFLYPYPYFVPAIPPSRLAFTSAQSAGGYTNSNSYAVQQPSVPAEEFQGGPARQNPPALQSAPATNSLNIRNASYALASPHYSSPSASGSSATVRPAVYTTQQVPNLRPEVQNVIRALRAMPPAARQRQMDSGRYSNLTPAELQIVRRAANVPPA
jgi:hypothetical protein